MTLKIVTLTKAFPGSGYETNAAKSRHMASSADEYFESCRCLRENNIGAIHVYFPLMHQCIELYTKSLVAGVDTAVRFRDYGHNIVKLMNAYRTRVQVFDAILLDTTAQSLLVEMESAYLELRYGEAGVFCDPEDFATLENIVSVLRIASFNSCKK